MIRAVVSSHAELFLNLDKVGPANEANDELLAKIFEELNHLWRGGLYADLVPLTRIGMGN